MYVIFTSSFLVVFVHRTSTTYKETISYLLIEKSIFKFDHLTPMEEVSWICIPYIISYKYIVTHLSIINPRTLIVLVLEMLLLQTLRHSGFLSYISLIAGFDVTGYHQI